MNGEYVEALNKIKGRGSRTRRNENVQTLQFKTHKQEKVKFFIHLQGIAVVRDALIINGQNAYRKNSARSEMVDFGSGQGRSDLKTAGVAELRRGFPKSENAGRGRKMPFMDGREIKKPPREIFPGTALMTDDGAGRYG